MSDTVRKCRAGDNAGVDEEDISSPVMGEAAMAIKEGSVEHGERLAREEAETLDARREHESLFLVNSTGRQTEPPRIQSCSIRTSSSSTISSKDETGTYCPERNSTSTLAVSVSSRQNSSIINSTLLEAIRRVIKCNSAVTSSRADLALKGQIAGVQHKVVPVKSTPVLLRVLPPSNKAMVKETGSTIGNSSSLNNFAVTNNATNCPVILNSSRLQTKPTTINGRSAGNGCLASLPTAAGCGKTVPQQYECPEARAAKEKIIAGYKRILDNAAAKWGTPLLQRKDINCDTMVLNNPSPTAHNARLGREDTVNVLCSGPIYNGDAVSKTSYSSQKDIPLLQREDITIGDVLMLSSRMGITVDKDKNARVSDRPLLPDTNTKCKSTVSKPLPIHDVPLLQRTDLAIDGILPSKSVVDMYYMNRRENAKILNHYLKNETGTEYKASKNPLGSDTKYKTCKVPSGSSNGVTSLQRKEQVFGRRSTCRPAPHSDTKIMASREKTVEVPNGLMADGTLSGNGKKVLPRLASLVMQRKYKTVTDVLNDKPPITTYSRKKAARNRIKVITCTTGRGSTGSQSVGVDKAEPKESAHSLASQKKSSLSLVTNQVVNKEGLSRSVMKVDELKEMCNGSDTSLGCAKVNKWVVYKDKMPIQSNNINVPQDKLVNSPVISQTFAAQDINWKVRQERNDSLSDKIASNTSTVCSHLHQLENISVLENSIHAVNYIRKQMQYVASCDTDDVSKGKCVPAVIYSPREDPSVICNNSSSSVPHMNGQLHKEPDILDGSIVQQETFGNNKDVGQVKAIIQNTPDTHDMDAQYSIPFGNIELWKVKKGVVNDSQTSITAQAAVIEKVMVEGQDSSTCEHDGQADVPSNKVPKECLGLLESTVLKHEDGMREGDSVFQMSPSQDCVQDAVAEEEKLCDYVPVEKGNVTASQLTAYRPTPSSDYAIMNVDEASPCPSVGQVTALTVNRKLVLQQGKCATVDGASVRLDGTAASGCRTPGSATVRLDGSATVRLDGSAAGRCRTPCSATTRLDGSAAVRCRSPGSATTRLDGSAAGRCRTPGSATTRLDGSAVGRCRTPGSTTTRLDGSAVGRCRTPGSATTRLDGSAAPVYKIVVSVRPNSSASIHQRSPVSLERQFVISPLTCAEGVAKVCDDDEAVSTRINTEECGEVAAPEELLLDDPSVPRTVDAASVPSRPSAHSSDRAGSVGIEQWKPIVDISSQARRWSAEGKWDSTCSTSENGSAAPQHSNAPRRVIGGIYADVIRDTNVTSEAFEGKEEESNFYQRWGRCSQQTGNRFDELNQNAFQTFSEFRAQQLPSQLRARGLNAICAVAAEQPASNIAGLDSKSRTGGGVHFKTKEFADCKENRREQRDDLPLDVREREKPGHDRTCWRRAAGPSHTMQDLIYHNPPANPMRNTAVEPMIFMDYDEEDLDPDESVEEAVPQVILNDDGQLVIDERSLFVDVEEVAKRRMQRGRKRKVDGSLAATIDIEPPPRTRSRKWKSSETLKFYRALNAVGTDFSTMEALFLDRTRRELKQKFLREDRAHRELIDRTLQNPGVFTTLDMEQELEEERFEKKKKEEEELEKERLRKERKDRKLSKKQQQLWDRRNEQLLCNKIIFKSKRNYKKMQRKIQPAEGEAWPVQKTVLKQRRAAARQRRHKSPKRREPQTDLEGGQDLCKLLEETISKEVAGSCEGRSVLPQAATTPGSLLVLSAPSPTGRVYKVFMVSDGPNSKAAPEL